MRHAEDRSAAEQLFGDSGLSARGEQQARARAADSVLRGLSECWVSPLERAARTAELVLDGRDVPMRELQILAEGRIGALEGLGHDEARERYPDDLRLGRSVVARLAATGRTAPEGETRDAFLDRARAVAQRLRSHLDAGSGRVLVVSHGGLLNYALQALLDLPLRDSVPFGFDHTGYVRVLRYSEPPAFGPLVMLRF